MRNKIMLSKELSEELKSCEKNIDRLYPVKEKTQDNHKQQSGRIYSIDKQYEFELFIRRNLDLPNDFSIGLQRKGPEGTKILCRYNGDHGLHRNKLDNSFIKGFHKHQYNNEYKKNGLPDDAYAEETKEYSSAQEAIAKLCKDYNIKNYSDYFKTLQQEGLFDKLL